MDPDLASAHTAKGLLAGMFERRWELGEASPSPMLALALPEAGRRLAEQQRHREYRKRVKREAWGRELKRRMRERTELAHAVRDPGAWW